jgi:hypothetical protein
MKSYDREQFNEGSFMDYGKVLDFTINLVEKESFISLYGGVISVDNKENRFLETVHLRITGWDEVKIKWYDKVLSSEEIAVLCQQDLNDNEVDNVMCEFYEFLLTENSLKLIDYDFSEIEFVGKINVEFTAENELWGGTVEYAIKGCFRRMVGDIKDYTEMYLFVRLPVGVENRMIVSERDGNGYYKWQLIHISRSFSDKPDFKIIESKYNLTLHKDIKDYYGIMLFYYLCGTYYIKELNKNVNIMMDQVLPNQQIQDLMSNVEEYYHLNGNEKIQMIPVGLADELPIVVNNDTGEVLLDNRIYAGAFIKLEDNLASFIGKIGYQSKD